MSGQARPALVALLATGLVGCGPKFSARAAPPDNILRWALSSEITTLDPAVANDGRTLDCLRQVFEGLVTIDTHGAVQPCLADSWTVDADGQHYRFHLHPGIQFSDGRVLTAEDVKYSFDRAAQPIFAGSLVPFYLGDIKGVAEAIAGKTQSVAGVQVIDSLTVGIELTSPKRSFLAKLAYPIASIVGRTSNSIGHPITAVRDMIGTGPFIATSWSPSGELSLRANKKYWSTLPLIDGIRIQIVKDPATRLNLFKAGLLDLTSIQNQDVSAARRSTQMNPALHLTPKADLTYLQFNSITFGPLKDSRVRKALAMSIDRRWIADEVMAGIPKMATGVVPPDVPNIAHSIATLDFDPKQAAMLLASAGYPNGKGFPELAVAYLDQQRDHPAVEAIVTMWRRYLGINASGRAYSAATILEKNLHHQLPCFYTGWTGDYPDPEDYLNSLFSSKSPANGSGFRSQQTDNELTECEVDNVNPRRARRYGELERRILLEAPIIPLFYVREPELLNPNINGVQFSPFGHLSFATAHFRTPLKNSK